MSASELYKEKLFLGELDKSEARFLSDAGFSAAEQKRFAEKTAAANRTFLAAHPADAVLSAVRSRRNAARSRFTLPSAGVLSLAGTACACCLILAFTFLVGVKKDGGAVTRAVPVATPAGERIKGADPLLFVYKKSPGGAVLLGDKAVVHKSDVLQVSYVSGGRRYGAIISVDGNGVVTRHYPETNAASGELERSGEKLLDFSYELDDAPYFERFIFISADTKIPLAELDKALAQAKNPDELLAVNPASYVPQGCRVAELTLIKE